MSSGEKNPELTVCQIRTAAAALVQSWSLGKNAGQVLLERTAENITYQQQQNAKARKSHTKRTRRKLRELGIRLATLTPCSWDDG